MATRTATASFELNASPKGALLLPNGDEFRLKGVAWGGANTKIDRVPFGLDQHDIEWFGHFLHSHGFNSVKLCFSHAAVLANKKITHSAGEDDDALDARGARHYKTVYGAPRPSPAPQCRETRTQAGLPVSHQPL